MRNLTRTLLGILFSFVLLAAAIPAEAEVITGVTLEKLGEFAAPREEDPPEEESTFWEKAMYIKTSPVQYLEDGLYAVAGLGDGVNCFGLFDEEGTRLLPFEAAVIRRLNARYLTVYYATEQTTDRSKALIYISDGFRIGQGYPKDGDAMYKGYARLYDTVEKSFVGDLQTSGPVESSGRLLVLSQSGTQDGGVFDEKGALVMEGRMKAGSGFLIRPQKQVYDEDLNLRYTSDTQLSTFPSEGAYLLEALASSDGYRCVVIDIDGNVVLPGPFKSVFEEAEGVFSTQKADGEFALIGVDDEEIAVSAERFTLLAAGYWYGKNEEGYLFVGPEGVMASGLANRPEASLQLYEKQPDGEMRSLALNSGEWTISAGRGFMLVPGLVYCQTKQKNGDYATTVYNLFTGEAVLEGNYDSLTCVGRFVIARRGDVCELYRVRFDH